MQPGLKQLWDNPGSKFTGDINKKRLRPFEFLDLKDNVALSKWKQEFFILSDEEINQRVPIWLDNLCMYAGYHFTGEDYKRRTSETTVSKKHKSKPFPIGITNTLVEQKVSKITANKVGVKAIPPKDTREARNSADLANKNIAYLDYVEQIEAKHIKVQRATHVFGECYLWQDWYPERGPVGKESEEDEQDKNPERIVVAKMGDGVELYGATINRSGEVGVKIKYPWQVRFELNKEWEESNYVFIEEREYLEKVYAKWGSVELVNSEGDSAEIEDYLGDDSKVPVFYFYHEETEFLQGGRLIIYVGDCVVSNTIHPHNKHTLPIARHVDIEIPSEPRPISFIELVKPLNRAYDGITFLMLKALAQGSHLKWIVPRRSTNHTMLASLDMIVEYTGGVPPRLEMPKVLTGEMFSARDALKTEIKELAAVHGVSFGDIPKRVDSGLAIQSLDEQETKRDLTAITNYRKLVRQTWQNIIDIIGKHYDTDEARLIKVLGPNNKVTTEAVKGTDLAGPYEIRIVEVSPIANTVGGRIDRILKLREAFPNTVTDAYAMDALDLAQDDKYISYATSAVRKAEYINERLMSNKKVNPPKKYEDLITHWQVLMKLVQSQEFEEVSIDIQNRALERLGALEYLMWEKTTKIEGRGYSAKLQALDGFPVLYALPDPSQNTELPEGAPIPLNEGSAINQVTPQGPVIQPGVQDAVLAQGVPNGIPVPSQST